MRRGVEIATKRVCISAHEKRGWVFKAEGGSFLNFFYLTARPVWQIHLDFYTFAGSAGGKIGKALAPRFAGIFCRWFELHCPPVDECLSSPSQAARRDRRAEAERESSAVAEKLLENLVKSQAVKQALGDAGHRVPSGSKPGRVPGVRKGRNQKDEDIFELAPLPESEEIKYVHRSS